MKRLISIGCLVLALSGCNFFTILFAPPVHYVAVGGLLFSEDGESWSRLTMKEFTDNKVHLVEYGGGTFVAIGDTGATYHSTDGLKWEAGGYVEPMSSSIAASDTGRFVAVSTTPWYSDDGITWAEGNGITAGDALQEVTYGNGHFVTVGGTSTYVSTDGIHWSLTFQGIGLDGIAYGANGRLVGVSRGSGAIVYSDDNGTTWTDSGYGNASNELSEVAFGNNRFVAAGNYPTLYYSSDGVTWETSSIPTIYPVGCNDIAFGNGLFLAATGNGVFYSNDGITWVHAGTEEWSKYAEMGVAYKP